jgi:tetratricopeptide (TPR) repeat protein
MIGKTHESEGNHSSAASFYESSAFLCEKYNIKYLIYANACFGLGNGYMSDRKYRQAIDSYEKTLPVYQIVGAKLYNSATSLINECKKKLQEQLLAKEIVPKP